MTTKIRFLPGSFIWIGLVLISLLLNWRSAAQGTVVDYAVLPDSRLTDECLLCGRPSIPEPMAGHFRLQLLLVPGPFSYYTVEDFTFVSGVNGAVWHSGAGTGSYRQSREAPGTQDMTLDLAVTNFTAVSQAHFTNGTPDVTQTFPKLQLRLTQSDGTFTHELTIDLHAEPVVNVPLHVLRADAAGVVLAWPASYGPGTVFWATQLGPLPDWQETQPKVTQVGDEYQATLPAANAAGFFWLHLISD
ncbi:MAG TPA: hypothetical protein VMB21_09950 [Candidatus Limnocylindria bacterium]|jgi:hypothetical protein|nr:hypothetical protein [Candidatus Limnocylindria bacterium]